MGIDAYGRASGIRERIEAVGARPIYLPAYSPELDLIGLAFAELKAWLRAEGGRTVAELWDTIGRALKRCTPDECRNYLPAAGCDAYELVA